MNSSSNFCGLSPCGYGSNCPHAHFFEASVGLLAGVRFTSSLHCHDQVTGPSHGPGDPASSCGKDSLPGGHGPEFYRSSVVTNSVTKGVTKAFGGLS